MHTGIFIIAHTPLASALRAAVLHVFPDAGQGIVAFDVQAHVPASTTKMQVQAQLLKLGTPQTLVLTDIFGATPCNVAQQVVDGVQMKLLAGVNLAMLLRTVNYSHEPLDQLVSRALSGGVQSIMQVVATSPQNQKRNPHDPTHHDHSQ
jgi:PTS system ascorbate-specific IIA component